jgi:hypothetical protein
MTTLIGGVKRKFPFRGSRLSLLDQDLLRTTNPKPDFVLSPCFIYNGLNLKLRAVPPSLLCMATLRFGSCR